MVSQPFGFLLVHRQLRLHCHHLASAQLKRAGGEQF